MKSQTSNFSWRRLRLSQESYNGVGNEHEEKEEDVPDSGEIEEEIEDKEADVIRADSGEVEEVIAPLGAT